MPKSNCTCTTCDKRFYKKPSVIQQSTTGKHYCSKECQYRGQKRGEYVNCTTCSKRIYKARSDFDKNITGQFFCSKKCQAVEQNAFGALSNNFKGKDVKDYRVKAFRYLDHLCNRCGFNDHTKILQVHHKDANRSNNNIENLEILCPNCHCLEHFG